MEFDYYFAVVKIYFSNIKLRVAIGLNFFFFFNNDIEIARGFFFSEWKFCRTELQYWTLKITFGAAVDQLSREKAWQYDARYCR